MHEPNAMLMKAQATLSNSTLCWRAARCRVITYISAISPLLLLIVLANIYPDLNRTEIPDWRPLIARADEMLNRGDRYEARRLYLHVDRVAYWQKDWEGLIAAACGINKLDGVSRPRSRALSHFVPGVDDCGTRPKSSGTGNRGKIFLTARLGRSRICGPGPDPTQLAKRSDRL